MNKFDKCIQPLQYIQTYAICILCIIKKRNGVFYLNRKKDSTQYPRRRSGSTIERKSSYEADKQIEYPTSTLMKRNDSADKMMTCMGSGGKSIDYDVCPYATFSVMQTTASSSRTPTHHRTLSQTDCYETPDHNIRGLIDKSYGKL